MTSTTATLLGVAGLCAGLLAVVVAAVVVLRTRRRLARAVEETARVVQVQAEWEQRLARIEDEVGDAGSGTETQGSQGDAGSWKVPVPLTGTVLVPGETPLPADPPTAPVVTGPAVPVRLDGRLFVDVIVRESVVRGASLAHGLRHALAPATRNRIRFEMGREVKRSRKQRKAETKRALREFRARQRARIAADDDAGENVA